MNIDHMNTALAIAKEQVGKVIPFTASDVCASPNTTAHNWSQVFISWCIRRGGGTGNFMHLSRYSGEHHPAVGEIICITDPLTCNVVYGLIVSVAADKFTIVIGNGREDTRHFGVHMINRMIPEDYVFDDTISFIMPEYDRKFSKPTLTGPYALIAKKNEPKEVEEPVVVDERTAQITDFQNWLKSYSNGPTKAKFVMGTFDEHSMKCALSAWKRTMKSMYGVKTNYNNTFTKTNKESARDINPGTQSDFVVILKGLLYYHNYNPNTLSPVYDNVTKEEVIKFQKDHDLPADGIVTGEMWSILFTM